MWHPHSDIKYFVVITKQWAPSIAHETLLVFNRRKSSKYIEHSAIGDIRELPMFQCIAKTLWTGAASRATSTWFIYGWCNDFSHKVPSPPLWYMKWRVVYEVINNCFFITYHTRHQSKWSTMLTRSRNNLYWWSIYYYFRMKGGHMVSGQLPLPRWIHSQASDSVFLRVCVRCAHRIIK